MKIKKYSYQKSYQLIELQIIKSKIYRKNHYTKRIFIENIACRLKNALNVIYRYHLNNKRIMFVGNPVNVNKHLIGLLKRTNHSFIPRHAWINGSLTNRKPSFGNVLQKEGLIGQLAKRVTQLKKKSDLMVVLDSKFESCAIKESYAVKLPVIALNCSLEPFDKNEYGASYKIPGSFITRHNEVENNLFYSLLKKVLKKSNIIKKRFPKEVKKIKGRWFKYYPPYRRKRRKRFKKATFYRKGVRPKVKTRHKKKFIKLPCPQVSPKEGGKTSTPS